MQKIKMVVGATFAFASSLISISIISKNLSAYELKVATICILAHGLFGILDFLKPLIVREISRDKSFASLGNILLPNIILGFVFGALLIIFGYIFARDFLSTALSISVSLFIFFTYSPFWAVLEGRLEMGTAYLIRSFSVGCLYLLTALGSLLSIKILVTDSIIVANVIALMLFLICGRKYTHRGRFSGGAAFLRTALGFSFQNIFKAINDFGDRIAASMLLPINSVGQYNLISDFAGRINFPSQITSSYYYPILCRDHNEIFRFLIVGVSISLSLSVFYVVLYVFGQGVYIWYFGRASLEYFPIFCALIAAFSNYSLSFFGQAVARSQGMDRELAFAFGFASLMGVGSLYHVITQKDVYAVLLMAGLLKLSSLIIMASLYKYVPRISVFSGILIVSNFLFVVYISMRGAV